MRQRLNEIYKPEQDPHSQYRFLIGPAQWIKTKIVSVSDIGNLKLPFHPAENLFSCCRSLLKHPEQLRFWQCAVLREPLDHMGFIFKQQSVTSLQN